MEECDDHRTLGFRNPTAKKKQIFAHVAAVSDSGLDDDGVLRRT